MKCSLRSIITPNSASYHGHLSTHYNDVIMISMASQIIDVIIVRSIVSFGADQRKHQSSASPVFERGIHRWTENSPHKRLVTRKMFSFDDDIMLPCFKDVDAATFQTGCCIVNNYLRYQTVYMDERYPNGPSNLNWCYILLKNNSFIKQCIIVIIVNVKRWLRSVLIKLLYGSYIRLPAIMISLCL